MIIKRLIALVAAVGFAAALNSCKGKEPPAPVLAQPVKVSAPPAPGEAVTPEAKVPQPPVETKLRNPFMSFLAAKKTGPAERVKTPLECCDTSIFRLMAVITGDNGKPLGLGLIQTPEGKRYVVRTGDRVGLKEGRITGFTGRSLIVEELERDDEGNVASRNKIELSLPKEEERIKK